MSGANQPYLELLPVEVIKDHLKSLLRFQLQKGLGLSQILPAIEADALQRIKSSLSAMGSKKEEDLDRDYVKTKRTLVETEQWLDCLIKVRQELLKAHGLPENEKEAVQKIQEELQGLDAQLKPYAEAVLKKRELECSDLGKTFLSAIDTMESATGQRVQKILLDYEKWEEDKYAQITQTFEKFFKNLRAHSEIIVSYIAPRISAWNAQVLKEGRGLMIARSPSLPCTLLFSLKGQCHFVFENVGHLLGSGLDKLVIRSISIPQGKIEALIKPLFKQENSERFKDIWMETEFLMQLKNKRGVIDLNERMVFEIDNEKTLFLVEDYYWDGTAWDYLKYPIQKKIESSRLSSEMQREILTDLLMGLAEIHEKGIIHHDIKPDNILLDFKNSKSKAVIADFQLATSVNDKQRILSLRFIPRWMPPEFARIHLDLNRSNEDLSEDYWAATTPKLDVWSLGLVFYCFIAYALPFWVDPDMAKEDGPEQFDTRYHQIAHLKKGWLPEGLKKSIYFPLLEKMLEPNPEKRCTAQEALKLLERSKFTFSSNQTSWPSSP